MTQQVPLYQRRVRELRDAVERLMDGDEPEAVFPGWWRPARVREEQVEQSDGPRDRLFIAFHQPARRPRRPSTADGSTSFHFSHRAVVRVQGGNQVDGVPLPLGAAAEHCRYVEREGAVAKANIEASLSADCRAADGGNACPANYVETDDELKPYAKHLLAGAGAGADADAGLGDDGRLCLTDLRPVEARSAADRVLPLPGGSMAGAGWQVGLLLSADRSRRLERERADNHRGVRGAADRSQPVEASIQPINRGRGARAISADHTSYIERATAVPMQADGAAAILTNIALRQAERLHFWEQVEENEAKPSADHMSVDLARAPEFWARVALDDRCPTALRKALRDPDPAARQQFVIPSGREMRRFLEGVPGWVGRRKKMKGETQAAYRKAVAEGSLAKFHDGRGGRIQYRIIGELPNELSMGGRMRALRRIAREFEQRGLPFVLAMHAPDFQSDERQWHFHLDYYDRPCRILDKEDIERASAKGLTPVETGVGQWDFAARFYKGKRRDRTTRSFKQDKVKEVRGAGWIDHLRGRVAFAVNAELRREGQHPRFDPRSYDRMGIKAEPGEHMGVKLNAAEGKGEASDVGRANELKQWRWIEQTLVARRTAGYEQAASAAATRRLRVMALDVSNDRTKILDQIDAIADLERIVVDTAYEAEMAAEIVARASSRAVKVRTVNQRWIDADSSGEHVLSARHRGKRVQLRDAAMSYLDRLSPLQNASVDAVSLCNAVASDARVRIREAEQMFETMLDDVAGLAERQRALFERIDRERPLIHAGKDGLWIAEERDPRLIGDPHVQAELASRYALQERQVDALIGAIEKQRENLLQRFGKWTFEHKDPAIVESFSAMLDHPRLAKTIERAAAESAATANVAPPPPPEPLAEPVRPTPAPRSQAEPNQQVGARPSVTIAAPISHASAGPVPEPPPNIVPPSAARSPAADRPTPVAATLTPKAPSKQSEAHIMSVQKIIADKVVLRVGDEGRIDADALAKRGVIIAEADRGNPRLLGRAREQRAYARQAVEGFVTKYPGFVDGDDISGYRLSSKAMAIMTEFARDYDDNEMQSILKRAKASRATAATGPAAAAQQSATGVAAPPPAPSSSMSVLVRDHEMIEAAMAHAAHKRRQIAAAEVRRQAKIDARAGVDAQAPSLSQPSTRPARARRLPPGWGVDDTGR